MSDDTLRQIDEILDSEHEKDPLARQLLINARLSQTISALRADNERLRGLVERAYREGWECGAVEWFKYGRDQLPIVPPASFAADWEASEAREALKREGA